MLDNFKDKKVLVIGDIILDKYVHGDVNRISPEAPIPVLRKVKEEYRLGGAANVAANLTSLGAKTWIIGRVGEDNNSQKVIDLLTEKKINVELLIRNCDIPTTTKTRYVCDNYQLLRVDEEDTTSIVKHPETLATVHEDLERHLQYFDAIIISDYCKGMIYTSICRDLINLNEKYNKFLIADTKQHDINDFCGFNCIKPNKVEFKKLFPLCIKGDEINHDMLSLRLKQYNIGAVLITLGKDGMILQTKYKKPKILKPTNTKAIIDLSGAGDTVLSVYTLAKLSGFTLRASLKLANKAAGIVISRFGTSTIETKDLV